MLMKLMLLGVLVVGLSACGEDPKPVKEAWEICIEAGGQWKDQQCFGITVKGK